jgi:hypothetical protein
MLELFGLPPWEIKKSMPPPNTRTNKTNAKAKLSIFRMKIFVAKSD